MAGAVAGAAWVGAAMVAVSVPVATGLVGAPAGWWHNVHTSVPSPAWLAGKGRIPFGPWQTLQSARPSNECGMGGIRTAGVGVGAVTLVVTPPVAAKVGAGAGSSR